MRQQQYVAARSQHGSNDFRYDRHDGEGLVLRPYGNEVQKRCVLIHYQGKEALFFVCCVLAVNKSGSLICAVNIEARAEQALAA